MGYPTLEEARAALPDQHVDSETILDVGVLRQFGPNCGFYALYLVMDFWYRQGRTPQPLPPRFRHVVVDPPPTAPGITALRDVKKPRRGLHSLRQVGKQIGSTTQGTVLSTQDLGRVALRLGAYVFDNPVTNDAAVFLRRCITYIEGGLPVIVGIDINIHDGTPYPRTGATRGDPNMAGHWAVVHGVRRYDNGAPPIFVASHWGQYFLWQADDLTGSNLGLRWYPREVFRKRTRRRNRVVTSVTIGDTTVVQDDDRMLRDWEVVPSYTGRRRVVPLTDISGMRGRILVVRPHSVDGGHSYQADVIQPLPGAIWQPDNTTSECRHCQVEFGVFTRKHHCRVCGHIYCDDCTDQTTDVRNRLYSGGRREGVANTRVCASCYAARNG